MKTMPSHRQRATQLKTVQDFGNARVTVDKTIALEIRGSRPMAKMFTRSQIRITVV